MHKKYTLASSLRHPVLQCKRTKRNGGNTGNANSNKAANTAILLPRESVKIPCLDYRTLTTVAAEQIPKLLQHWTPAQVACAWYAMQDGRMKKELGPKKCWSIHATPEDILASKHIQYAKVKIAYIDTTTKKQQYPSHHVAWVALVHQLWENNKVAEASKMLSDFCKIEWHSPETLHMCHNCGWKSCCRQDHLGIYSSVTNQEQNHCHFFIELMVQRHGSNYQNSEDYKYFTQHLCPHNSVCF